MRPSAMMHHPMRRSGVWPKAVGRNGERAAIPAKRWKFRRVKFILILHFGFVAGSNSMRLPIHPNKRRPAIEQHHKDMFCRRYPRYLSRIPDGFAISCAAVMAHPRAHWLIVALLSLTAVLPAHASPRHIDTGFLNRRVTVNGMVYKYQVY